MDTLPQPSSELLTLLNEAILELRSNAESIPFSSRFERVGDVADYIERLTEQFKSGDTKAGRGLYLAFCATSDWDDAFGSHELGNRVLLALQPFFAKAV